MALVYCEVISPQYVGKSLVRFLRTFIYPTIYGKHVYDYIYYLPVEKRTNKNTRIEILQLTGNGVEFKCSKTPKKIVLHFRRFSTWYLKSLVIISIVHFILMNPLVRYYIHQAGCGKNNGIGSVYATPLVLQRGYGIGSFLSGLWRVVRPILWSGAKALGQETLCTGGDILTDIVRSSPDQNPEI